MKASKNLILICLLGTFLVAIAETNGDRRETTTLVSTIDSTKTAEILKRLTASDENVHLLQARIDTLTDLTRNYSVHQSFFQSELSEQTGIFAVIVATLVTLGATVLYLKFNTRLKSLRTEVFKQLNDQKVELKRRLDGYAETELVANRALAETAGMFALNHVSLGDYVSGVRSEIRSALFWNKVELNSVDDVKKSVHIACLKHLGLALDWIDKVPISQATHEEMKAKRADFFVPIDLLWQTGEEDIKELCAKLRVELTRVYQMSQAKALLSTTSG